MGISYSRAKRFIISTCPGRKYKFKEDDPRLLHYDPNRGLWEKWELGQFLNAETRESLQTTAPPTPTTTLPDPQPSNPRNPWYNKDDDLFILPTRRQTLFYHRKESERRRHKNSRGGSTSLTDSKVRRGPCLKLRVCLIRIPGRLGDAISKVNRVILKLLGIKRRSKPKSYGGQSRRPSTESQPRTPPQSIRSRRPSAKVDYYRRPSRFQTFHSLQLEWDFEGLKEDLEDLDQKHGRVFTCRGGEWEEEELDLPTEEDAEILQGRGFVIQDLIGKGSFAKVFEGAYKDIDSGSTKEPLRIACKILDRNHCPKKRITRCLPREIELSSRMKHRHLARIFCLLRVSRFRYYLFTEFGTHGTLRGYIIRNGPIRERQARNWFCQLLRGLYYMHVRDIAHRDLKCENIIICSGLILKITDFAFARYFPPYSISSDTYCGSLSYAAPEILHGIPYNPLIADRWSLGVVLFAMLNAGLPFKGHTPQVLRSVQMRREFRFYPTVSQNLSKFAKILVFVMLNPFPENRKSLPELWGSPWIQLPGDIDRQVIGPGNPSHYRPQERRLKMTRIINQNIPPHEMNLSDHDDPEPEDDGGNKVEVEEEEETFTIPDIRAETHYHQRGKSSVWSNQIYNANLLVEPVAAKDSLFFATHLPKPSGQGQGHDEEGFKNPTKSLLYHSDIFVE